MTRSWRPLAAPLRRYGAAVLAVATAVALTLLAWPVLRRNPTMLLFPAVMVSVWLGGLRAGLAASALAAVTVEYLLIAPPYAVVFTLDAAARLIIFALVAWLVDSLITARRRAEVTLHEMDRTLQAVVQASPIAIMVLDADGTVRLWSPGAERMFGWSASEVIGRPNPTVPPDRIHEYRSKIATTTAGSGLTAVETRRLRKDGSLVDVSIWSSPLRRDGQSDAVVALLADITTRTRAEAEHERLLRERVALLDCTPSGVLGVDLEGRCTFINRAAADMLGYHPQEVIGRNVHDLAHSRHLDRSPYPREDCAVYRALREGIGAHVDDEVVWRRDGTALPMEYWAAPITVGDRIEGAVVTIIDVRERKRAESERRRLLAQEQRARAEAETAERRAALLARASEILAMSLDVRTALERVARLAVGEIADWCGIDLVEGDGRVRHVALAHVDPLRERAARDLFRRFPVEVTATHPMTAVVQHGTAALYPEIDDRLIARMAHGAEDRAFLRSLGLVSGMVVPLVARGRTLGAILLATDASGRRYGATDLALAEQLARRAAVAVDNARLYAEAREARKEAELANRAKDHFLATLSHELRTPLNAMLGWVRLLQAGRLDGDATTRALATIERNTRLQGQLISDLLDVSGIIAGKIRLDRRSVEPQAVIEAATEGLRPSAHAKRIALRSVLDPAAGPVFADPDRLQQIVWNLLSNAIKFTPEEGRVTVRLDRRDRAVAISVADTGVGISPEFLPVIFDRFRQVEGTTRRSAGSLGLGLAIVRHLVELHGGTVEAHSGGPDRGAVFTVILPLGEEAIAIRPSPRHRVQTTAADRMPFDCPPLLEHLRVLVVDDEPDARELIATVLEECHATVTTAASVREALAELDRSRPDILVSDIGMPGENGHDLIREVRRRHPDGRRIPALALTAFASAQDRERALEAGYDIHVAKPVDPPDLVEAIVKLSARLRGG